MLKSDFINKVKDSEFVYRLESEYNISRNEYDCVRILRIKNKKYLYVLHEYYDHAVSNSYLKDAEIYKAHVAEIPMRWEDILSFLEKGKGYCGIIMFTNDSMAALDLDVIKNIVAEKKETVNNQNEKQQNTVKEQPTKTNSESMRSVTAAFKNNTTIFNNIAASANNNNTQQKISSSFKDGEFKKIKESNK